MDRPFEKHIDSEELDALVPSSFESLQGASRLPADIVRQAQLHVRSCAECQEKLQQYQRLVTGVADRETESPARGPACPPDDDVDWAEVAAGLWPELRARQLILHAAMCDYCGQRLRTAVKAGGKYNQPVADSVESKAPRETLPESSFGSTRPITKSLGWLMGAVALVAIAAWWSGSARSNFASRPPADPQIAELAVATHRQYAHGDLPLALHTDSPQVLNAWLQSNAQLAVFMPASTAGSLDEVAYHLEGARLLPFGSATAAYVAYQANTSDLPATVSLMVTPAVAGLASGGMEIDFPKVSFHYSNLDGYRVVSWSVHGMTYALVSQEDMKTQHSCLVCHSSKDPELDRVPLRHTQGDSVPPFQQ